MGLISLTNDDLRDALNLSAWYPSFQYLGPLSGTTPISPVARVLRLDGALLMRAMFFLLSSI